jgi:hypothetical protein
MNKITCKWFKENLATYVAGKGSPRQREAADLH